MNKQLRKDGDKRVPVEDYSTLSLEHTGTCHLCGKHGPASSEEHMAKDAARNLLLDKDGNYRGDDTAVFLSKVHSDNDTRAPNNFIQTQNDIIGLDVDKLAEHHPDMNQQSRT